MKASRYTVVVLIISLLILNSQLFSEEKESEKSLGLKEALIIGFKKGIAKIGAEDGFYKNEIIKILLPKKLKSINALVSKVDGGRLSEALILKMNRAAELAAPLAKDIFVNSIKSIKFSDVVKIVGGKGASATAYLKESSEESLKEKLYPIIKQSMEEVKAIKAFNKFTAKQKNNFLFSFFKLDLDIVAYVRDEAINGIFWAIGEEEKKIRKNPAARVTNLLKKVFG